MNEEQANARGGKAKQHTIPSGNVVVYHKLLDDTSTAGNGHTLD
jgi:hypothetical protein